VALVRWLTPRFHRGHRLGELLRRWRVFVRDADVDLVRLLVESRELGEQAASEFLDALDDLGLKRALPNPSRADDAIESAKMRRSLSDGKLAGLTLGEFAERARARGRVYVTTMSPSKGT
jgi:hypothetical protein